MQQSVHGLQEDLGRQRLPGGGAGYAGLATLRRPPGTWRVPPESLDRPSIVFRVTPTNRHTFGSTQG